MRTCMHIQNSDWNPIACQPLIDFSRGVPSICYLPEADRWAVPRWGWAGQARNRKDRTWPSSSSCSPLLPLITSSSTTTAKTATYINQQDHTLYTTLLFPHRLTMQTRQAHYHHDIIYPYVHPIHTHSAEPTKNNIHAPLERLERRTGSEKLKKKAQPEKIAAVMKLSKPMSGGCQVALTGIRAKSRRKKHQ